MAAPDCPRPNLCSCGWGCVKQRRLASCQLLGPRTVLGHCACGWQCLRPRYEPPLRITWGQALQSQWFNDRRLAVARADHCFRLGGLAHIASCFHLVILSFSTIEQVHRWFRRIAAEQRIEDRKLALAVRFHAAVNSAQWTLPATQRWWSDKTGVHWPLR